MKNIRNHLSVILVLALLAVVLIVPVLAESTSVTTEAELKDALAKGGAVSLASDIVMAEAVQIPVGVTAILDLNGFTLSGVSSTAGTSALITNNGELTIEDSSEAKTGKITTQAEKPDTDWVAGFPAYANNTITNCGKLTVNGGRIENTTGEGFCVPIDNNSGSRDAILVVNGGQIVHTNGNIAVRQFANSATYKNSVTVNGGTLRSTDRGEDGYNLAVYSYTYGNSFANTKLTFKDGIIDGGKSSEIDSDSQTVSVTGGTFLGEYGVYSYGVYEEGFISGGSFAAEPEAGDYDDYLAADYSAVKTGDYYLVHKHALAFVKPNDATCTEDGNVEHYSCDGCDKLFADAEGKKEVTDIVIPQLIKVEEEKAEVSKDAVDNAIADAKDKA